MAERITFLEGQNKYNQQQRSSHKESQNESKIIRNPEKKEIESKFMKNPEKKSFMNWEAPKVSKVFPRQESSQGLHTNPYQKK